jgi:hypothetical protein
VDSDGGKASEYSVKGWRWPRHSCAFGSADLPFQMMKSSKWSAALRFLIALIPSGDLFDQASDLFL